MKIIDEKGRLFGKINLIDFIVIVFLISFIPIFYLGYKIISRRNIISDVTKVTELELYCKFIKIEPGIIKLITVGDKEIDNAGTIIGELTWLGETKPYEYQLDIGAKEPISKEDSELKEILAKLKIKANIKGNNIYYKDKLIAINSPLDFVTSKYTFQVIPINEDEVDKEIGRIEMELGCKLVKVKPEILKLITVGDKEIDNAGTIIGELTWLGETKPYEYQLDIGAKEPISKEDSELKEILAKLKIKANIKGNNIYYKDKLIAINSPLDFVTSKYTFQVIPINEDEVMKIKETGNKVRVVRVVTVDLYTIFKNLSEDAIRLIAIGDKGLDEKGEVVAEILDIGKVENNRLNIDLGSNNFIDVEDREKKQVSVKMRLKADIDEERNLYFNNEYVKYNLPIKFRTDKYVVEGTVAQLLVKERSVKVQVRFSGILPEIAKLVKEQDREKRSTGSTLAILKDIISNEPTKIQTLVVQEQKFIAISSPFQRDIIANLDLLCEEKDIGLFFKDYPIKVGNILVFTTDLYSLSGTITGLEIK